MELASHQQETSKGEQGGGLKPEVDPEDTELAAALTVVHQVHSWQMNSKSFLEGQSEQNVSMAATGAGQKGIIYSHVHVTRVTKNEKERMGTEAI